MKKPDKVRNIVASALSERGDPQPFEDDESLVVSGRLSSLEVVNLLLALEQTFGFSIEPDEFDLMKFDTVDSIVELLGAANEPRSR